MTNADVTEFVLFANKKYGREIGDSEAATYLSAQDILEGDPDNVHAAAVVKNFNEFLITGEHKPCFSEFLLPLPLTDEEKAADKKIRADYIEIYRKLGFFGIVEGDFHAAQAFENKHNLTSAQILAMSDAELRALAT